MWTHWVDWVQVAAWVLYIFLWPTLGILYHGLHLGMTDSGGSLPLSKSGYDWLDIRPGLAQLALFINIMLRCSRQTLHTTWIFHLPTVMHCTWTIIIMLNISYLLRIGRPGLKFIVKAVGVFSFWSVVEKGKPRIIFSCAPVPGSLWCPCSGAQHLFCWSKQKDDSGWYRPSQIFHLWLPVLVGTIFKIRNIEICILKMHLDHLCNYGVLIAILSLKLKYGFKRFQSNGASCVLLLLHNYAIGESFRFFLFC